MTGLHWSTIGLVAFAALAVWLGYNYEQTGTLGGGGSVAVTNGTSSYSDLIDALSQSSATFGSQ